MRMLIVYLILVFLIIRCSILTNKNEINVIAVKSTGQFFDPKSKNLFEVGNTKRIAFLNDDRLYIISHITFYPKEGVNVEEEEDTDSLIRRDTAYVVHAIHKGDTIGLEYTLENFSSENGREFNIDSLMKSFHLDEGSQAPLNLELGRPNEISKRQKVVIEKFLFKKTVPQQPDSIYRYYNKELENIDFTFSKKLDKERKSKLVKTLFVFNAIPSDRSSLQLHIPKRVMEHSMIIVNPKDRKKLLEIFVKFSKDRKRLLTKRG